MPDGWGPLLPGTRREARSLLLCRYLNLATDWLPELERALVILSRYGNHCRQSNPRFCSRIRRRARKAFLLEAFGALTEQAISPDLFSHLTTTRTPCSLAGGSMKVDGLPQDKYVLASYFLRILLRAVCSL